MTNKINFSGSDKFVIDAQSGKIFTTQLFQRDDGTTEYTITIKAEDGGKAATGGARSVTKTFKVFNYLMILNLKNEESQLLIS